MIRRETDSIVFTGGEPTLRTDIEELLAAARRQMRFRSVMLITNGTLLDRRAGVFENLTGLVISLDALTMDPANPLSKPAALPKVMENIALARSRMPHPRTITISTVIEEWNIAEIERILDWAGAQGFVFATQSALKEKMPNLRLIANHALSGAGPKDYRSPQAKRSAHQWNSAVDRNVVAFWRFSMLPHNVPARLSERRCFLSLRAAAENRRQSPAGRFIGQGFLRAGRSSMAISRRARESAISSET